VARVCSSPERTEEARGPLGEDARTKEGRKGQLVESQQRFLTRKHLAHCATIHKFVSDLCCSAA